MRVADEDRQLSAKELENLILKKNRETSSWEKEPADVTISALDEQKIKDYVTHAGLSYDNILNTLQKLDVAKDRNILNAALLFYGKKTVRILRCAVFGGTTSSMIIDQHDFEGDILSLIDEAHKYVLKNINIGMKLKGIEREDVPEISPEATREAIINAFCHRDYRDPDFIQIAIFKDRVEIRNPGGLYEGLTIEELRHGNISRRRNPLIAELLRRIGLVEAWGRGIPLILEKEPGVEFKETAGIFITSFNRPSFTKTTDKGLTPQEIAVINLIKENSRITQKEMAYKIGLTEDGVRYHMDKLKKMGFLKRIGGKKAGYLEVTDK